MAVMKKEQERDKLHRAIWAIANELRHGDRQKKRQSENMTPVVYVQSLYGECEISATIASVREQFRAVKKRTCVTDMKVYTKPEERIAYYVIMLDGNVEY